MRACQIFHYQWGLPKMGGYHFRRELLTLVSTMLKFNDQDTKKISFTLYVIMLKNDQTYFKILGCSHCKIFKVCLAIFQHYETKG